MRTYWRVHCWILSYLLKEIDKEYVKQFDGMKSMVIYPIFSLLITGVLMYFIIGPVFTKINVIVANWLNNMGTANAVLLELYLVE